MANVTLGEFQLRYTLNVCTSPNAYVKIPAPRCRYQEVEPSEGDYNGHEVAAS